MMPNDQLPGVPPQFADVPSVQMVPPPDAFLPKVRELLTEASADLGPFQSRLSWILTDTGVNIALISKVVEAEKVEIKVGAWFAKSWGQPQQAGLMGTIDWNW